MYKLLLCIFAVALVVIQSNSQEIPPKCRKLFRPHFSACCKHRVIPPPAWLGNDKECFRKIKKFDTHGILKRSLTTFNDEHCALETCLAEKRGFLADDGTLNDEAIKKHYEEEFASYPDFYTKVQDNCLDDDKWKAYGHKDQCDIQKISHCFIFQVVTSCTDFFTTNGCENATALVNECKAVFN